MKHIQTFLSLLIISIFLTLLIPNANPQSLGGNLNDPQSFGEKPKLTMDQRFAWYALLSATQAPQGTTLQIEITLEAAPEHYTYKKRTEFSLDAPQGILSGEPVFPKEKMKFDPIEKKEVGIYEGTVKYHIPLQIAHDAPLGKQTIIVNLRYQGCSRSPNVCYLPQKKEFTLDLTIVEGSGKPVSQSINNTSMDSTSGTSTMQSQTTSGEDSGFESMLSKGYLWAYLACFGFGILTSLTPCVFPLIPITVSIFGAREAKSKLVAFSLALTYVMGIVVMYSSLGYFAARTGAVFGQFMSNPLVIIPISLFFIVMGISMLGAFEIRLPSSWQGKLSMVGGKGYLSAFLMGLVAGVIAAPCTGPFLFSLLLFVAQQANPAFGFSLLFVYAFGLGTLFLIVGTFSGLINNLPKSGQWMEGVKNLFAIILFAFALYYLKDIFAFLRTPLVNSWITYLVTSILFIIGIILGALHLSFHTPNMNIKIKKALGVLLCVVALYVGVSSPYAVGESKVNWIKEDLERGLTLAQEQNRPVMIDFYADWCVECKKLDAYTYTDEAVGEALKNYVNIKIDLTEDNQSDQKIKKEYNIAGLPLIVFYDSQGNRLDDKRINEYIGPQKFLEHIKTIQ